MGADILDRRMRAKLKSMVLGLAAALVLAVPLGATPGFHAVTTTRTNSSLSSDPGIAGLQCERPRSYPLDTALVVLGSVAFMGYGWATRRKADTRQPRTRS